MVNKITSMNFWEGDRTNRSPLISHVLLATRGVAHCGNKTARTYIEKCMNYSRVFLSIQYAMGQLTPIKDPSNHCQVLAQYYATAI